MGDGGLGVGSRGEVRGGAGLAEGRLMGIWARNISDALMELRITELSPG